MRGWIARWGAYLLPLAAIGGSAPAPAKAAPPAGYTLAWADEFNGTAVDTSLWNYRTGVRYWSTQLPANVRVDSGNLVLDLKKETVGTTNYTAGGVISKQAVRYGYYETSMKTPGSTGWHTSFWMMRSGASSAETVLELDALENDSIKTTSYSVNVHRWQPSHVAYSTKTIASPDLSAGFNTIGCEFMPTSVKYYLNGTVVQTVDATQFPHGDLNIWLTSIAAPLGGTPAVDDSRLPAVALYDYVRYYSPNASTATTPYTWTGAASTTWSGTANWAAPSGRAVTGTTANAVLQVASGTRAATYDASLGTTRYYNVYGRGLAVGTGSQGGMLSITGGTFSTLNSSDVDAIAAEAGVSGTLSIAGGMFIGNIFGTEVNAGGGGGRMTVTSGTASLTSLVLGGTAATGGTATLELTGGVVVTNEITSSAVSGTSLVVFNGGTLRAGTSSTAFFEGLTSASIRSGSGTIDTNGKAITVAQPLLADAGSPGGGLIKTGSGTLTLTGTNTYSGGTTIRGGTLSVAADNRLGATSGRLTLDGGALSTTSGFTLAGTRTVTLGTAGGTIDHAGSSTLTVAGNVTGTASTLTVRSASTVNAAVQFDGTVSLGSLVLSGSTTGAGLRQSARITAPVTIGAGQTLHLNGSNSTGTATSTYTGLTVVLQSGTLRNRYGGNSFQGGITLTADSTLENRVGNGNFLTVAADRLALGTSTLTVQSGTAAAEWVSIAGGITGGTASGLRLTGGGQLRLAGDNRGFAGLVIVEDGELRLDSATAVNAAVEILFSGTAAGKALTLNAASAVVGGIALSGREQIDVGTGSLTVLSGLTRDSLVAALGAGRGTGSWQGTTGILSAAVAADVAAGRPRAVGWIDDGTGMRVAYAAPGDANLDGGIDILDAAAIMAAGRFDSGLVSDWSDGDFGYDGLFDILDVAEFTSTGLFDAGPYGAARAAAPVTAVPEPSAAPLAGMLAVVALGLRASGRILRIARFVQCLGLALLVAATVARAAEPIVAPADGVWRLLPVGDSITEGGDTFTTWRVPLREKLTAAGYVTRYVGSRSRPSRLGPLAHEGYGGKTAEFVAERLATVAADHPADVVLLHAGHNHFAEENPVPGIVAAQEAIIGHCRAANPRVIVLLAQVIPSGKLPKYSYIPELNTALAVLAAHLDTPASPVRLVDQASGFDPVADTIDDRVHPNERGAAKMADRWFEALRAVLPTPAPLTGSSVSSP